MKEREVMVLKKLKGRHGEWLGLLLTAFALLATAAPTDQDEGPVTEPSAQLQEATLILPEVLLSASVPDASVVVQVSADASPLEAVHITVDSNNHSLDAAGESSVEGAAVTLEIEAPDPEMLGEWQLLSSTVFYDQASLHAELTMPAGCSSEAVEECHFPVRLSVTREGELALTGSSQIETKVTAHAEFEATAEMNASLRLAVEEQ